MFKVKLTARAKRELKNISKLHKDSIGLIFEEQKEDALIGKPLNRKLTGLFSYRIGVYRIIYKVNLLDETIIIVTAGHRSTAYN